MKQDMKLDWTRTTCTVFLEYKIRNSIQVNMQRPQSNALIPWLTYMYIYVYICKQSHSYSPDQRVSRGAIGNMYFFDVRVFNPFIPSYLPSTVLLSAPSPPNINIYIYITGEEESLSEHEITVEHSAKLSER